MKWGFMFHFVARHVSLHLTYMATFQDKSQTTARKQQAVSHERILNLV